MKKNLYLLLILILVQWTKIFSQSTLCYNAPNDFLADVQPNAILTEDFNADGKFDLAISNNGSNNISILFGTGFVMEPFHLQ